MKEKTSIIVSAYDTTALNRRITSLCLSCIEMYTDHEDYELIFIDNEPVCDLYWREMVCKIDKHIINNKDIGFAASINQGVKESDPENKYLCFIHTDAFVQEGWLRRLIEVMKENKANAIWPAQRPMSRDEVKLSYTGKGEAWDDAGLNLMTRDIYNRMGGLDEVYQTIFNDGALRKMIPSVGGKIYMTNQVIINHIGAGTLTPIWNTKFQERRGPEGLALDSIKR